MLASVEKLLDNSVSYHQAIAAAEGPAKLLSPTLALATSWNNNKGDASSNSSSSSSSILRFVEDVIGGNDHEVGNDEIVDDEGVGHHEHTASVTESHITAHVDMVITSALALSQTVRGHEDTIHSAKDMDIKALDRSNGVLDALDLGDCERIEQYMHDLAMVQRTTAILRANENDIVACETMVRTLEELNALKLNAFSFLKTAKPVV